MTDVAAGTGRALVIEGEAGIGKTRLLREAEALAAQGGLTTISGEAHALEQDIPFAAIAAALDIRANAGDPERAQIARLLEGHPSPSPDPEAVRFRITDMVTDLLERLAAERPLCLILDDLHWADDRSLLVVDRLVRRIGSQPMGLIGSIRWHPRRPAVERLLDTLRSRGGVRLALRGLSEEESVRLISKRLGVRPGPVLRSYARGTAGNPLYLAEIALAALEHGDPTAAGSEKDLPGESLPPSLRITILQRLRILPDDTVAALRTAAVLGSPFDVAPLALVLGRPVPAVVAALAPAADAGVLVDRPPSLAFHHDLVRDAVYEDLVESARRALHDSIARVLDQAGYPASQVAEHLVRGDGRLDEAGIEILRRAADEVAVTDPGRAAELIGRALDAAGADHPGRNAMVCRLAEVLAWSGRVEEAERRLVALTPSVGPSSGPALWALLQVRYVKGDVDSDTIARSERLVRQQTEDAERRRLLGRLARLSADAGEAERALRLVNEVLGEADGAVPSDVACDVFNARATALYLRGAVDVANGWIERSYAHVRAGGAGPLAAIDTGLLFGRYLSPQETRRNEALEAISLAARLAEEHGQTWALAAAHQYLGYGYYFAADWDGAIPALETAAAVAEETGFLKVLPAGLRLLAAIAIDRGDLSAARRHLDECERLGELGITHPSVRYPMGLVRADLALAEGRVHEAVELLRKAPEWVDPSAADWNLAVVAFRLAATARQLGRDDLRDLAKELLPTAGDLPRPARDFARAAEALIDPDPGVAARLAEAHRHAVRPDYAELCEAAALCFTCVGARDEAVRWYRQAREVWVLAGAARRLSQVDGRLRDLGVRRRGRIDRRRPPTGWESLTEAETRVADLVAQGLLYREVADRLFLSRRTVETHVAHILQKLGLRNRAELTAAHARRRPGGPSSTDP